MIGMATHPQDFFVIPQPCILRSGALAVSVALLCFVPAAQAQPAAPNSSSARNCPIQYGKLVDALKKSVKASGGPSNGGFDNNEWAVVVGRDGKVCAVAFSGVKWDDQWPGSRAIAAEKANTANSFSVAQKAIATANLYAGAQPGGLLYGITLTDPPATDVLSAGDPSQFGTESDPMVGKATGGIVVFGGGLALYDGRGIVGALGVSGDTSCADHNVAWRVRHTLDLDHVPSGVSPNMKDAIIYDIGMTGTSPSGFGHPICVGREAEIANDLGAGIDRGVPK
jgi:uncharacterized protein GlcG (DUF336 family)